MKIGIVSDTHGHFEPALHELFAGVEHILHAGDVGGESVLLELERIAPVTAVRGNMDNPTCSLRETEVVELCSAKFLVQHIVKPTALTDQLDRLISNVRPAAVVFGHTHNQFCERIGEILFLNPGYAGRPKFTLMRSVALLHCQGANLRAEFFSLDFGLLPPRRQH